MLSDGGGWRSVGRQQGDRNRQATPDKPRSKSYDIQIRHAFVHTVIDDHSRVGYAEVHDGCPGGDGCEVAVRVDGGPKLLNEEALTLPRMGTGQGL
jgi:hypothetical protein